MSHRKRLFDLVLALMLIMICAPLFLVLVFGLLLAQGRPVFYFSERMKSPDQAFLLCKLRSMTETAADQGVTGGDKRQRITCCGRWLRASRLDELPQLWNILRGDLSFVGPRPPLRRYVVQFPDLYHKVLNARPGVTGLATVICHQSEAKRLHRCQTPQETEALYTRVFVPRKARLDLIYQRHQSLRFDLYLLWRTLPVLLWGSWVK
ncbi:MAG: lipopolysaccharide/colanic/teichoic acid biosynthesis glycosyltransferase [Sulfitobacter sp.]|jgi:lipopolysaccharide/colanic/teichoic acid biosynthesis glycosyltransferase